MTAPVQPEPPPTTTSPEQSSRARPWVLVVTTVALSAVVALLVSAVVVTQSVPPSPPAGTRAQPDAPAEPVTAASIVGDPTAVGEPVGDRAPQAITVELETVEVEGKLTDGTAYTYWTFGGTVPGPMVRVRQGDRVTLRLTNDESSSQVHSIDLHAVNGPGGGAVATQVTPGEAKEFSFTALNPGVYVYHCASPHIPTHIANGMYGLIVVEPPGGLEPVDREFSVMQGEIYTDAERGTPGLVGYDAEAMKDENPTYVVFNGQAAGLTGEQALTAEVGERVRIFVGNGGPNLVSSFHVIGEVFDVVHDLGAREALHDVQTTLVPPGGAAWVEFTVDVPGSYTLVDHAITRAVDGGAIATLEVTGEGDPQVFDGEIASEDGSR